MEHRFIETNGVTLHAVVEGEGIPVIMCHGFPGLWYSWHKQLASVAAAGFMAVAIDQLGVGRSDRPHRPSRYSHDHFAADMAGLIDALGADRAVLVGHDFGALAVWGAATRIPERLLGVVALSVPYDARRPSEPPTQTWKRMSQKHFYHRHYFQEYGVADRELNADPAGFVSKVLWALSGDFRYLDVWKFQTEGNAYLDVLPDAPALPWDWLSQSDFDFWVAEHAAAGFTGGLNWYRAVDDTWRENEARDGQLIEIPSLYIAGARDTVLEMRGDGCLDTMASFVPDLRGVHVIPDEGHTVQLEAPDEVNRLLVDFLAGLS